MLKKLKESNELKSEIDVITNCFKDETKHFSDAEIYTDDDGSRQDTVIGFRSNVSSLEH